MANVITSLDKAFILNLCISHFFFLVYTFYNSDNDINYVLLSVSITIGKKMFNRYINILKAGALDSNSEPVKYTE